MARSVVLVVVAVAGLLTLPLSRQGGAETALREAVAGARPVAASERPAGTLVFLSRANRLGAIDVASGRRTVRRVRSVAGCGPEMHVTGGRVIFAGVQDGRTVVFSAPVSLERPPTRLGAAHAFVPSATEGRVWLVGVDCSRPAMAGVREVTVDGRETFATRRRVPGSWLEGAVRDGLVLLRGRKQYVWDPRARGDGRRLGLDAMTDAHGALMAGCDQRSRCRDLVIADAATGATIAARPGGGRRLELDATFSPDGSLLAAPAVRDRRWSVALVDTRDGATTIVPGARTGAAYPQLSWSASSGWLFIRSRAGRVLAYRPGAPRAVRMPFRLPRRSASFVAG